MTNTDKSIDVAGNRNIEVNAEATIHHKANWSFLIPAAGVGSRLALGHKFQLNLNDEPLWQRAIRRAMQFADQVIIAVPSEWVAHIASLSPTSIVIGGGTTRHETIQKMLTHVTRENVLIHDMARPFASSALIKRVANTALEYNAAGCFLPTDAPLAYFDGELLNTNHAQLPVGMLQSPLAFKKSTLEHAYLLNSRKAETHVSTIELVKQSGQLVKMILGERDNFKITSADDYRVAQLIAAAWDVADLDAAD